MVGKTALPPFLVGSERYESPMAKVLNDRKRLFLSQIVFCRFNCDRDSNKSEKDLTPSPKRLT